MASGFPESVPAWYTGPSGASSSMSVGGAADRGEREPAADDLAEDREVGRDAEVALRAGRADAEAGDHLVEDEERAVRACTGGAGRRGSRRVGRDEAHVGGDRLDEHRGEVGAVLRRRRASSAARSLYGTTIVSATVPAVTPAEPGRPSVATPLPAATSSASTWPW